VINFYQEQELGVPHKRKASQMTIAFTNKDDGGVFCNDCASGDPHVAKAIEVPSGINCDDCSEVIA